MPVDDGGAFNTPLQLTTGRWSIIVTASGAGGKTTSLTRHVTVAYRGVNLVVEVQGGNAWIKVWVDGKVATPPGRAGDTLHAGQTLSLTGNEFDRGPDRLVGCHVLHAERPIARGAGQARRPRDVAVHTAGAAAEDAALVAMAGDSLVGLAERLQDVCLRRGLTVAVAESCTGGLVADALTDVPGSSGYFLGGIVSYADAAKERLLGVSPEVLAAHGAVSAQAARAMAEGVRDRFEAAIAASVTGIAGPDGGSEAKPVGLTYVAVADEGGVDVRRFQWSGDRIANKESSAEAVLELLVERVGSAAPAGGR